MTERTDPESLASTPGPHLPHMAPKYPDKVLLAHALFAPGNPMRSGVELWAERFDPTRPWVYPQRSTTNAAGFDLYAISAEPQASVAEYPPGWTFAVSYALNIRLRWSNPHPQRSAEIIDRSSMRKRGVSLGNPGIIDSDYSGELIAGPFWLLRTGREEIHPGHGEVKAIAQLIIRAPEYLVFAPAWGERRQGNAGGFGSTSRDPTPESVSRMVARAGQPYSVLASCERCEAPTGQPCKLWCASYGDSPRAGKEE